MLADNNTQNLNIAINAQMLSNRALGGVETVLLGLINNLGKLTDGSEEYKIIISDKQHYQWLAPYLGKNQTVVLGPQAVKAKKSIIKDLLKPVKKILRPLKPFINSKAVASGWPQVPMSNGFYESLGCQVLHLPSQDYILSSLPTIFNPHDLQHLHYPSFFQPLTIAYRETVFPLACRCSNTVVVGSEWIKQDVIKQYNVSPDKVQVIPVASPTEVVPSSKCPEAEMIRKKYNLIEPFALYPATTWEHKNHIRLLRAIALLRDQKKYKLNLICSGDTVHFWAQVREVLVKLKLEDQVKFIGKIPFDELKSLYRLAQFVIIPTLFEAASAPLFEGWQEGVAVACSNVTSLPCQAKNAALLFNPFSIEEIADVLALMSQDEQLRKQLIIRGNERLKDFNWQRTAKAYRAVYRRASGVSLTQEDRFLLSWDWMMEERCLEK